MPAYRDNEGKIVEEETVRPHQTNEPAPSSQVHGDSATSAGSSYEERTRLARPKSRGRGLEGSEDIKTRVVGSRRRTRRDPADDLTERVDPMDDPVVGWLVVTSGPGKGSALPLGSGTNTIGRSATARVSVDFGDDQISRSAHAIVTYDPRNRDWYVERGQGKNLAYVDDQPVLQPTLLEPHTQIQLGSTSLRFVPLCTKDFDWQDTAEGN